MTEIADLKHDFHELRSELNAMKAELYAHQILVGDLVTQFVYPHPDWRERLDVLRANAIEGARKFELIGGEPALNAALQKEIERRIDEHFSSALDGLTAWHSRHGS